VVSAGRAGWRRKVLAAVTAGTLGVGVAVIVGPAAQAISEDFTSGAGIFTGYSNVAGNTYTAAVVGGEYCVEVPASSGNAWDIAAQAKPVVIEAGQPYILTFDAHATRAVNVNVQAGADYPDVFGGNAAVTDTVQTFTFNATPDFATETGEVGFQLGGQGDAYTICFDNFSLVSEVEILPQTSFAAGLGDWAIDGGTVSATTVTGGTCFDVPADAPSPWSVNLHYDGIPIETDGNYILRITASATPATIVRALVGETGGSYTSVMAVNPSLSTELATYEYAFTANNTYPAVTVDPVLGPWAGQVALQLGANGAFTFCVTDVSLVKTLTPPPPYAPETGPRVRVNQVGYLPFGAKTATLVTDATTALPWTLYDGATAVATGTSTPRGVDPTAGINVHTIDFSAVTAESDGYTLVADGEISYPFSIATDLYEKLRVDSLSFFYPMRSGIEILGDVAGADYARAAGHIGVDPNQGDDDVACLPAGAMMVGAVDLYDGYTCDYTLDVTGGWYDAGDHGKYVVNGGISVSQLLSSYERNLNAMTGDQGALGDGTLRVPEAANDVPDVLDEARWELEWMLKMQVPAGEQYAGMVHHKVTDVAWTGIPMLPANDPQPRYLHRPSTAATLNLAAAAAQGARLFNEFDPGFAGELLDAAEVAYAAAEATPDLYAPDTNANANPGGGPYNETEVEDEFYWAATELYLTTGEAEYLADVEANAYHLGGAKAAFQLSGFDWRDVASVARIDLATVPSLVPNRAAIRRSVVAAADDVVEMAAAQPFGQPYVGVDGAFEWGSNGKVLNNIALLGAAFDVSGHPAYLNAAVGGMDYILGRNALNNSYVTGYGEAFSQNMHSRWFAAQASAALPHPPVGTVSGGPNSDIPDPVSGPLLGGCAPQFCYVDDIGAYGVNELTINWNSALAYVASFLADADDALVEAPFTDVPVDFPFVQHIRWLANSGITTGFPDGTFRPGANVERQAMAAFLYRAAGSPDFTAPATSPFVDVRPSDPFYKEITWLADSGITTGYADGTFRSLAPVARDAMAAFLYRATGSPDFTAPATPTFSDVGTTHPFYDEIEWLAAVQVANGYSDGTYRPAAPVARDAMAAFLNRIETLPVLGVPPIGIV